MEPSRVILDQPLHRPRRLHALLALGLTLTIASLVVVGLYLDRTNSLRKNLPVELTDQVAFPAHAALGTALNRLGVWPSAAAIQWIKAASHARTDADVDEVARGLAAAAKNAGPDGHLDQLLCSDIILHGSPTQIRAAFKSGIGCDKDEYNINHVPDGSPIHYTGRPPTQGTHYNTPYPSYGLFEVPIPPGYWVHNLEHGAVVIVYNCADPCPDLVDQLKGFYDSLPPDPTSRTGVARVLITPYADMDDRIAIVSWGQIARLDHFDDQALRDFFWAHIDRGPECNNLLQCADY